MPIAARIVLAVLLIGIAGYCVFGFLATLEPMHDSVLAWRIGYGAVGIASLVGAVWVIRTARRSGSKSEES